MRKSKGKEPARAPAPSSTSLREEDDLSLPLLNQPMPAPFPEQDKSYESTAETPPILTLPDELLEKILRQTLLLPSPKSQKRKSALSELASLSTVCQRFKDVIKVGYVNDRLWLDAFLAETLTGLDRYSHAHPEQPQLSTKKIVKAIQAQAEQIKSNDETMTYQELIHHTWENYRLFTRPSKHAKKYFRTLPSDQRADIYRKAEEGTIRAWNNLSEDNINCKRFRNALAIICYYFSIGMCCFYLVFPLCLNLIMTGTLSPPCGSPDDSITFDYCVTFWKSSGYIALSLCVMACLVPIFWKLCKRNTMRQTEVINHVRETTTFISLEDAIKPGLPEEEDMPDNTAKDIVRSLMRPR